MFGFAVDVAKTLFHGYTSREGTLRQHRRTPVAGARTDELVKIVGTLRGTGAAFTAPLSGATCVWYASAADTDPQFWDGEGGSFVEGRAQDVFLDDDTGSALVHMHAAEVSLQEMRKGWSYEPPFGEDARSIATIGNVMRFLAAHGMVPRHHVGFPQKLLPEGRYLVGRNVRYREAVLRQGDRVAVLGRAVHEPDPTVPALGARQVAFRLVLGEPPDGVIVSNEPSVWS